MAKSFDDLVRRTTTRVTRQRAARRSRQLLAELFLREIRESKGKSQREVADLLGIKQPSLSKLEAQDDIQISTLQGVVEALGGKLHVVACFRDQAVRVRPFNQSRRAHRRAGRRQSPRTRRRAVVP